ncbi:hypothetical protein AGRA3207_007329 [Actinomadura graeca]|uniref:DUF5753 domain-containing protein n=1 Tax=Actinomadura graeca TaxID=2750812 RepID=A0ABX8R6A2_9ACTN|nr:DUF5753 domain-containing protein [Actinomadura graeca]QXJ25779.1 hypothetical protein AGRA3207_007329 [Actinomadura graeca]
MTCFKQRDCHYVRWHRRAAAEIERNTDMAKDDRVKLRYAVVTLLQRDHRKADEPTFIYIEQVSADMADAGVMVDGVKIERVARSTANDLLREVHSSRPRWKLVLRMWAVLHHIADQHQLDTRALSTLAELRRCYHQPARPRADDGQPDQPEQPATSASAHIRRPCSTAPHPLHGACRSLEPTPVRVGDQPGEGSGCGTDLLDPLTIGLEYPIPGGARGAARRLLARARQRGSDAWWRDYRHVVPKWFGPHLTLEAEVSLLRIYAPRRIPGLLQTPDYARHVITEDLPASCADDLAHRIELRRLRQQVLRRPDPPTYWAIINRRALFPDAVPPAVRRGQLRHLITMASFPHVTLQLIDGTRAEEVVSSGPFTLMRFPEAGVGDIVYLENDAYGFFGDDKEAVASYSLLFNQLAVKAQKPDVSVSILLEMLDQLTS